MKSSENRKFNKTSVKSPLKLSFIIVFALLATQCAFFQSQKNRTYRLTNKTFEAERSLAYAGKEPEGFLLKMLDTDGATDQLWQLTPEGGDFYRIKNKASKERSLNKGTIERSLEVIDNETDDLLQMADSADDEGQLWEIVPVEKDFYRLSNKWRGANKSLATVKNEYYDVSLKASNGDASLWKKISVGNDYFRFVNKLHGDQVTLFPYGDGGLGMEAVKDDKTTYQHWKMESAGNNYYRIVNRYQIDRKLNNSLDFIADEENIFIVKMNATSNADSQKWKMEPVGNDYFRLTNTNGKPLQAEFISEYNLIMVDSDDNDPNQLWKIIRTKK